MSVVKWTNLKNYYCVSELALKAGLSTGVHHHWCGKKMECVKSVWFIHKDSLEGSHRDYKKYEEQLTKLDGKFPVTAFLKLVGVHERYFAYGPRGCTIDKIGKTKFITLPDDIVNYLDSGFRLEYVDGRSRKIMTENKPKAILNYVTIGDMYLGVKF